MGTPKEDDGKEMFSIRFLALVLISCLAFSMFLPCVNGWEIDTHSRMTRDSLEGLGWSSDDIGDIPDYASQVDLPIIGLPHPQKTNHRVEFYQNLLEACPNFDPKKKCTWQGAEFWAKSFLTLARRDYANGYTAQGQKDLGYAIHYIQDALCPPHIFPFSEDGTSPHAKFELYVEVMYGLVGWDSCVRSAEKEAIASPEDLRIKIVRDADWIYSNIPCSYTEQGGAQVGNPGLMGWSMGDEYIIDCLMKASSLVKGAAEYARFGPPQSQQVELYYDNGNAVTGGSGSGGIASNGRVMYAVQFTSPWGSTQLLKTRFYLLDKTIPGQNALGYPCKVHVMDENKQDLFVLDVVPNNAGWFWVNLESYSIKVPRNFYVSIETNSWVPTNNASDPYASVPVVGQAYEGTTRGRSWWGYSYPSNQSWEWYVVSWSMMLRVLVTGSNALGDLNEDGKVDMQDIVSIATFFGSVVNDWFRWSQGMIYDLNNDGRIDIVDLMIAAAEYGK